MTIQISVLIVTFIALISDLKYGRIYNKLTFPATLLGLIFAFYTDGISGLGYHFGATIVGILLYMPFAAFGFIGMGDVKLLGAIGAICGPVFMFNVFLYANAYAFLHAIIVQWLNYGKDGLMMLITSFKSGVFLKKTIKNVNEDGTNKKYKFLMGIDLFLGTITACVYIFKLI
jgi:prepilin peptidase CpaA